MKYLFLLAFVLGIVYNSISDLSLVALAGSMIGALGFTLLDNKR